MGGRAPLDLSIFGPGLAGLHNLQRKILRQQKNWRLNGEFVNNPDETPERYNSLEPGDILVMEFSGEIVPSAAKLIFLSKNLPEDRRLFDVLDEDLAETSMSKLGLSRLQEFVDLAQPPENHPIREVLLDADVEDAALGGFRGTSRLFSRPSGRRLTRENLLKAKANAEDVGRLGEEFVNSHLEGLKEKGEIIDHEWTADQNAVAPYDFSFTSVAGRILVDVKSTTGDFDRMIHVSLNELVQMSQPDIRYDIYRVYEASESSAKLRIAENVGDFGRGIIEVLKNFPEDVLADGISFPPRKLNFGQEVVVAFPEEEPLTGV
jgi:hypothetical protein